MNHEKQTNIEYLEKNVWKLYDSERERMGRSERKEVIDKDRENG